MQSGLELPAFSRSKSLSYQQLREATNHELIQRFTADQVKTTCLVIIATLSVGVMVVFLKPIVVPFILAFMLSNTLLPLVRLLSAHPFSRVPESSSMRWLRRLRIPWWFCVLLTIVIAILCAWFVGSIVTGSVESFVSNWESAGYQERARELFNTTMGWAEGFGFDATHPMIDNDTIPFQSLVLSIAQDFLSLSTDFFMIVLFAVYLLLGATREPGAKPSSELQSEIMAKIGVYVRCKLFISFVTALLTSVILQLLSVDLAVVFGVLAFVFNFIPNFGSLIALALPLPIVIFSPVLSTAERVLAVILPSVAQLTMGMCVEPWLLGKQLNQSEIFVLLSLMFWGSLWGLVGLFLAVPLTSVILIVLEEVSEKNDSRLLKDLLALAANDDRADENE